MITIIIVIIVMLCYIVFLNMIVVEHRQLGSIFIFKKTEQKKRKSDIVYASKAQIHGIYDIITSNNKNHGIYIFLNNT